MHPSQPKLLFSFCAFYILGFQVSFLLNKRSEFQSHWSSYYKEEQRRVEMAVVKMQERNLLETNPYEKVRQSLKCEGFIQTSLPKFNRKIEIFPFT